MDSVVEPDPDAAALAGAVIRLIGAAIEVARAGNRARAAAARTGEVDVAVAADIVHRIIQALAPLPTADRHECARRGLRVAQRRGARVGQLHHTRTAVAGGYP